MNLVLTYVCKSLPQCWSSVCRESELIHQVQSVTALGIPGAGSAAVRRDPNPLQAGWELSCRQGVTSLRGRAEEKPSAEKSGKRCSPGCSPARLRGFALPAWGFLPGCKGGGRAVCARSPCDTPVITVTRRWLTPAVTEATEGLVLRCTRQLVGCVIVRLPFLWEEI